MNSDLYLVIGLTLGALAIPSLLSAYSDSRAPRAGAVLLLIAGVLVVLAVTGKPGGYAINDIPQAFFRVIGRLIN
ncbi:MAG: hypothetical protein Q8P60_10565 [Pseudorhodobacter sp.]|nr:hypothetical protein [Pseudorhodobacter sp.]